MHECAAEGQSSDKEDKKSILCDSFNTFTKASGVALAGDVMWPGINLC